MGDTHELMYERPQALCTTPGRARGPHLIRRSPLEDVYRRAHCMYATGPWTTVSSCWMDTANALSGSTCSTARRHAARLAARG